MSTITRTPSASETDDRPRSVPIPVGLTMVMAVLIHRAGIDGAQFGDVAVDTLWVLGYTVVIAALAVNLFRRRMVG